MLNEPALVLNRNWIAVDVTTVRHAIVLGYTGVARFMRVDDFSLHDFESWLTQPSSQNYRAVHSISMSVTIPEVIVLTQYGGFPRRNASFTRRNLFRRDGFTCQYCGIKPRIDDIALLANPRHFIDV